MDLLIAMRTFVAVVQAGTMNAAAQKLNVTSALVGQRIAALENHLQVRLLNRTTRQHSLTDFGESYLEQCRDILDLVAQSEGKASDQQAQPQGRLRIAAPLSFGSEALIPALKSFTDMTPGAEIDVVLSDTNEDLIAGGIDAAFRIGKLEDSTLLQTQLAPYRMMVCASSELLMEHGTPRTPLELERFRAVLFSRTGRRAWRFAKDSEIQKWTPKATITVNSSQAVRVAAKAGMGIAMLPECLVTQDIAAGELVRILADWKSPEQPMALIYHRDRYRPQRLASFINFARSTFGNHTTKSKGVHLP
ncbi:LysR family transcriptional regulator [Salipiger sp. 1_MG-2023]|uniref:LysR family transcriptional regulator n=1 Tax=Salipiger sp. 1_MG-2023 TaxID=3062665 RepID=UPI0026E1B727|nr:LysR family transcriptional regulator [Salipiger sp. 1_MG-2023]MDO6587509.1 LysR family transcriptional regulator [Salipiger sp. 1_MG-2023]